jgi:hypothetical protein
VFKFFEVIPNGHGERQELFDPFLRLLKLDRDPTRFQMHPGWQTRPFLIDNRNRRYDRQLRLSEPFLS